MPGISVPPSSNPLRRPHSRSPARLTRPRPTRRTQNPPHRIRSPGNPRCETIQPPVSDDVQFRSA